MTLLAALVAGFLAGRLLWLLLRPALAAPVWLRSNYRGHPVPVGGGLVLVASVLVVEAGRLLAGAAGLGQSATLRDGRAAVVLAVAGFALLGVVDDLAGSGDERGFRGHLWALAGGRLTTGGLKLLAGAAVAVIAVAAAHPDEPLSRLVVDGAVVALAANLGNLFDRGPGRTIKVAGLCGMALAAATLADPGLAPTAVVVGAALALMLDDLGERVMLGDSGANPLGAALGIGLVLACTPWGRSVAAVLLLAANLLSELVSFSRVIDAFPPLRAIDRAGRSH